MVAPEESHYRPLSHPGCPRPFRGAHSEDLFGSQSGKQGALDLGAQTRVLADPGERCRSDLLVVMKGQRDVRPTGTPQLPVRPTCFFNDQPFRRSAAYTLSLLATRSRGKQHSDGLRGPLHRSRSCPRALEVRSPSPFGSPHHGRCHRPLRQEVRERRPGSDPSCSRSTSMRIGWMLTMFFTLPSQSSLPRKARPDYECRSALPCVRCWTVSVGRLVCVSWVVVTNAGLCTTQVMVHYTPANSLA